MIAEEKVQASRGQDLILQVTSDIDNEWHGPAAVATATSFR
jgi:hypothetical protein